MSSAQLQTPSQLSSPSSPRHRPLYTRAELCVLCPLPLHLPRWVPCDPASGLLVKIHSSAGLCYDPFFLICKYRSAAAERRRKRERRDASAHTVRCFSTSPVGPSPVSIDLCSLRQRSLLPSRPSAGSGSGRAAALDAVKAGGICEDHAVGVVLHGVCCSG